MKIQATILSLLIIAGVFNSAYSEDFEKDTFKTSNGDLDITFIQHGTLMFSFNSLVIHVDPVANYTDYSKLPKADIILITHHHGDHLNKEAIDLLKKSDTKILLTQSCYATLEEGTIMKNDESQNIKGIKIEAVPAYNLVNKRDNGDVYHPKGDGNGYVINFAEKRVYVGGDTENFPEMNELKNIDIAFLPMNLPYTMTPQMVADAVKLFHPKILYPYHFGNSDTNELIKLLADDNQTEIRIRDMK